MDRFSHLLASKKLKSSLSPPPTKLCLVCFSGIYEAHIVSIEDEDGCDSGFVRRRPDIQFKNIGESCFCTVDSILYIFSALVGGDSGSLMTVYSYNLLQLPKSSGVILDAADDGLGKGINIMCPKMCPFAVNCGQKILVFSTRILVAKYEWDDDRAKGVDFEIYDTKKNIVVKLPQLLFRKVTSVLQLFDQATKTWNPIFGSSPTGDTIEIEGFSVVNDCAFIVSTDIGRMFCIDLICSNHGWKLYEKSRDSVILLGYHQTFVTRSRFNVDGSGVYRSVQAGSFEDLRDMERNGCSESRLCFPPSSSFDKIPIRGSFSSSSTFVESYPRHGGTVFVVKSIFDDDDNEPYPYWVVDKLALDFEKLSDKDLVDEWAKCIALHKFVGELKSCCFICLALFPF